MEQRVTGRRAGLGGRSTAGLLVLLIVFLAGELGAAAGAQTGAAVTKVPEKIQEQVIRPSETEYRNGEQPNMVRTKGGGSVGDLVDGGGPAAVDGDDQDPLISLPSVLSQTFVPSPRAPEPHKDGFHPMTRQKQVTPKSSKLSKRLTPADIPRSHPGQAFIGIATTSRPEVKVSALIAGARHETVEKWTHENPIQSAFRRYRKENTEENPKVGSHERARAWKSEELPFANFESHKKSSANVAVREILKSNDAPIVTTPADPTVFDESYEIYKNRVAALNKVWFPPPSPSTSDESPTKLNTSPIRSAWAESGYKNGGADGQDSRKHTTSAPTSSPRQKAAPIPEPRPNQSRQKSTKPRKPQSLHSNPNEESPGSELTVAEDRRFESDVESHDTTLASVVDSHFDTAKRRKDNGGRRQHRPGKRRPHNSREHDQVAPQVVNGTPQSHHSLSSSVQKSPSQGHVGGAIPSAHGFAFKPELNSKPTYVPKSSPVTPKDAAASPTDQRYSAPQNPPVRQTQRRRHPFPQKREQDQHRYTAARFQTTSSATQAPETYSVPQAPPTYTVTRAPSTYSVPQAPPTYSAPKVRKAHTTSKPAQPAPQITQPFESTTKVRQARPASPTAFQRHPASSKRQTFHPPAASNGQSYLSVTRTVSGREPGSPDVVISHHAILPSGTPPVAGQPVPAGVRADSGAGAANTFDDAREQYSEAHDSINTGISYEGVRSPAKSEANYAGANAIFKNGKHAVSKATESSATSDTIVGTKTGIPIPSKTVLVDNSGSTFDQSFKPIAFDPLEHIYTTTPPPAPYDPLNGGSYTGQQSSSGESTNTANHPHPTQLSSPDRAESTVEPPVIKTTAYRTGNEPIALLPQEHGSHVLALVAAHPPPSQVLVTETTETPGSEYQAEGIVDSIDHQDHEEYSSFGDSSSQHQPEFGQPPIGTENQLQDRFPVYQEDELAYHNQPPHSEQGFVYASPEVQVRRPPRGRRPGGRRGCRWCTRRRQPHPQHRHRLPRPSYPNPQQHRPQHLRQQQQTTNQGIFPSLFSWQMPSLFRNPQNSFRRRAQSRRRPRSAVDPNAAELFAPGEDRSSARPSRGRGRTARLFDGPLSVPLSRHSRPFLHTLRPQVSTPPEQDFVALSTPPAPSLLDAVPVPVTQRHTAGPTIVSGDNRDFTTPPTKSEEITTAPEDATIATASNTTPAPQVVTVATAATVRKTAPVTPVPKPVTSAAAATTAQRRHSPDGAAQSGARRPPALSQPGPPPPPLPRPATGPLSRHQFRQYLVSGRPDGASRAKTYYLNSKHGDQRKEVATNAVDDTVGRTVKRENSKRVSEHKFEAEVNHTEAPEQNVIDDEGSLSVIKLMAGFPTPTPTVRPEDATVKRPPPALPRPKPGAASNTVTTLRSRRPAATRPTTKRRRPDTRLSQTTINAPRTTTRPARTTAKPASTTAGSPHIRTTQVKSRFAPQPPTSPRPVGRDPPRAASVVRPGPNLGDRTPTPVVLRPHAVTAAADIRHRPGSEELRAAADGTAADGGVYSRRPTVLKAHKAAASVRVNPARRTAATPPRPPAPTVPGGGLSRWPTPLQLPASPVSPAGLSAFRPARWYKGRGDFSSIGERVITQVAAPQLLTARRRSW